MANLERMAKNAAMLGNAPSPAAGAASRFNKGLNQQYFGTDTTAYAAAYGALASDCFDAVCQGLSAPDWYDYTPVRIRSSATSQSSMGETMPDDWHRVYIIAPSGISHIPQGAYMKYGGNTWIVFKPKNIGNTYAHAIVRRCNAVINRLDYYGNIVSVPMSFAKISTLGNANQVTEDSIIAKNYIACICQRNKVSSEFTENTRFVMGKSAYAIRGLNDFTREFTDDADSVHLLTFTVERNEPLPQDSMEKQCADYGSFSWKPVLTAAEEMPVGTTQTVAVQSVRNGAVVVSTDEHPIRYLFYSSDENVLTVDDSGLVTALRAGSAVITVCLAQNQEISADVTITAAKSGNAFTAFTTPPPATLRAFDSATFSAAFFRNGAATDEAVEIVVSGAPESAYSIESAGENLWKITGYAAAFDPLVITAVCGEYSVTAQTALTT